MGIKSIIITLVSLALLMVFLLQGYGNFLILIFFNLLILSYMLVKRYDTKLILLVYVQWVLYVIFLIIHQYVHILPGSGNDDLRFEKLADNYYYHYLFSTNIDLFQNSRTYSQFIAMIYFLGKPHILIPGLVNISVHTITVILLYKICNNVFNNPKVSMITATLYTLYPIYIFTTVITLREMFIVMFIMLFTYALLQLHKTKNVTYFFYSIIALLVGAIFHIGLLGLLLVLACYFIFISNIYKSARVILAMLFITSFVVVIFNSNDAKVQNTINTDDHTKSLDLNSRADYISVNESNGLQTKMKQVTYFLLKPFPWEVKTLADVIGVFDIWVILLATFLALVLYKKTKNKAILIVLITVYGTFITFAIGTYNYGTALRHRDKVAMLLTMFINYYIFYKKGR
ncbi:glycosyltransferase family 39 protein [Staphylococcus durrellii]|uniref:glycosyltransferase family 39 protein n=1 Tax=Staphylococcus durrellii TaxID=2781773 RepID=UPI00189CC219|nr:glycosyltransferase family 39 protein [Staphylococcus durrellii]MBF7016775.1 glycosyltransferase family 39 protein [Staphylococcus durrellii]